ncbi:DUF4861 domain-containing protein [Pseudochryseolinea flava]|uniref:DUF4861 domain-containing protein n=1 Tax=Pseudochryseolinea flava TaxID=2059302 RepID=A0A364Y359_9BACT|nr:DUF4861 domain-containing protein [Pseudochryseolinea flava]RAW00206.1 DUF4861 domain-containing protein [Pseudochryseolinea flava]
MKLLSAFAALLISLTLSFAQEKTFQVTVENPTDVNRESVLITILKKEINNVASDFNPDNFSAWIDKTEIASQFNKHNEPGIYLVLDQLKPREKLNIMIRYNTSGSAEHHYTKRTQAELSHKTGGTFVNREYVGGAFKNVNYLRVPAEHKDHSWFIRYEGPGWESDKVGYRFYLDQRNATDVFGKLTPEMVLQNVGQDGFDSYHEMQPWGMDVMKVGKSLGLGSIGMLSDNKISRVEFTDSVTCRIIENGDLYSAIETKYLGWKVGERKIDVKSILSIHGGTRLTKQSLTIKGDPDNISTGIVKDKAATLISSKGDKSKFGYLATWGNQSLNKDELGLAVFFDPQNYASFTEDEFSHIVKLKPSKSTLTYYFLAAWVKEPNGIQSEAAFKAYIDTVAKDLATPVKVTIKKR